MLMRLPRLHLRTRLLVVVLVCALLLLWVVLPYDNGLVLLVRWHANSVAAAVAVSDGWLLEAPAFPLDVSRDVGFVVKTGFNTRERLLAWLDALETSRGNASNVVVVGDYSTAEGSHVSRNGLEFPVYDALASVVEMGSFATQQDARRLRYYSDGWELDIMKVGDATLIILSSCPSHPEKSPNLQLSIFPASSLAIN